MKHYFKATANLYKKSEPLFIQHSGDWYYICEGHTAFKCSAALYELDFATVSPRFQMIPDGTQAGIRNDKSGLPVVGSGVDIKKIYEDLQPAGVAIRTSFTFDYQDSFGMQANVRIYDVDGKPVVFNTAFDAAMLEVMSWFRGVLTGDGERMPVKYDGVEGGFMMLPINKPEMSRRIQEFAAMFREPEEVKKTA